jgi:hypothetical protein
METTIQSNGFKSNQENVKMVTKRDGTQEPYNQEELHKYLTSMCDGLDMNYINVDIIVGKISMGLPQGKLFLKTDFTFRSKDFSNHRFMRRNLCVHGDCAPRLHKLSK